VASGPPSWGHFALGVSIEQCGELVVGAILDYLPKIDLGEGENYCYFPLECPPGSVRAKLVFDIPRSK
jgi:hypothetical protein